MWFLLWVTLPGAIALAAFGPAASDSSGAQAAAIIIALVFVPIGLIPIPFMLRSRGKQQQALELMTRGKRCPGQVVSVEDTNITINDNPRVKITVRAEPQGETPFTIVKTATVSRVAIPRAGDRCTVFYDPADREGKNGITFDHVPGLTTPAAPPSTSTMSASAGPDYTLPYARPGEDDDDPLEKIARLGELRDKGLISQAEFDDQKRRLLGEV
jgi:preprotein translocase subunit YajC